MRARYGANAPKLIVVEPDKAACLLASAEAGQPTAIEGDLDTIMAGLACGEPSLLAWQELERAAFAWMAVPDELAVDCMKLLAKRHAEGGGRGKRRRRPRRPAAGRPRPLRPLALGLEESSRILLFGTEGATDPELYARLVG